MFRIDSPGSTANGRFKESPLPATRVTADWLNATQEEIAAVIEGLGGDDLDKGNSGQMRAAIAAYVSGALASTRTKVERVITDDAGGDAELNPASATQLLTAIQRMIGLGIANFITLDTQGDDVATQRTITFAGGLFILKMGYHRETVVDEVTRAETFYTPFPNACWNVWTQDVIAAPSIDRDMWTQVIPGLTSVNGFTVQFQTEDSQGRQSSGFDWWAFGN